MEHAPSEMEAIRIREPGGPEVLELCRRPVPQPGPGQLLVRVQAAGVNRADIILRQPDLPLPVDQKPEIPGLEIAGEVVAVGGGVSGIAQGDQVCALAPQAGGYAEYCLAPAALAFPVPEGFGMPEAAALPEALLTVWNALFDTPVLKSGETVLIHGGTSGIGSIAIMLSAARGARVLATAGSDEKCDAMEAWGAEWRINYRSSDFVEEVREATGGCGVDVILDIVSGSYISRNVDALAVGGRLVQIGMIESPSGTLNVAPLMAKRASIIGATIFFQSVKEKARLARRVREQVWSLIECGDLRPVIDRVFPLAEAAAAQRRMESSRHIGKIILQPGG
jgi:putative PIG3 family NAD(P)H quinone oxidoreductase